MYCHWQGHNFDSPNISNELQLVQVTHLVDQDPTLEAVAGLPVDMGAERVLVGAPWERYEDKDNV